MKKKKKQPLEVPPIEVLEKELHRELFEQPRPTGRTRIPLQPSGFLTLGCIGTAI